MSSFKTSVCVSLLLCYTLDPWWHVLITATEVLCPCAPTCSTNPLPMSSSLSPTLTEVAAWQLHSGDASWFPKNSGPFVKGRCSECKSGPWNKALNRAVFKITMQQYTHSRSPQSTDRMGLHCDGFLADTPIDIRIYMNIYIYTHTQSSVLIQQQMTFWKRNRTESTILSLKAEVYFLCIYLITLGLETEES